MIGLGFLTGSVALVGIFVAVRYGSVRIPLKPFFISTSCLLYYLAFTFAGEGVKELQAGGMVGATPLEGGPVIGFLGVYPTGETLSLQLVLLLAAGAGLGYQWMLSSKTGIGDGKA